MRRDLADDSGGERLALEMGGGQKRVPWRGVGERQEGEKRGPLGLDSEKQREQKWEQYQKEDRVFVVELKQPVLSQARDLGWK